VRYFAPFFPSSNHTQMLEADVKLLIEQNNLEELHEALSENRIHSRMVLELLPFALTTNMGCAKLLLESELSAINVHDHLDLVEPVKAALCMGAYGYVLQILSLARGSIWRLIALNAALSELYSETAGHEQKSKYDIRNFFAHLPEELKKKML
jgi:hypothetical protein